jgi:ATP-dependent DNA helicase DinG
MAFEPDPQIWGQVNRESDLCLGRACPLYEKSFFYISRREQENAQILVANHHLLFAHLAAGGNEAGAVLPPFDALVIDEAHKAEDVASAYLGLEASNLGVARLIEILHHRRNNHTVLSGSALPERDALEKRLIDAADEMREATARFFENLQLVVNLDATRPQSLRLRQPHLIENSLDEPLARLENVLREARKSAERIADEAMLRELEGYTTRCIDMRATLMALIAQSEAGYVYWVEVQPRPADTNPLGRRVTRVPRLALCGAPIDVAKAMQETLFGKICPVIMTSATLSSGEGAGESGFDFLRERLGLTPEQSERPVRTLSLGSPFNYQEHALLYVTRDLPDPAQPAVFEAAASQRAAELLKRTEGRAFVLCTSFRMVDATAKFLRQALPRSIKVLKQGEMSRGKLLDEFRKDISSVLVGTTSFWQGVDVPGEALSCVVIMKLPFAVPDDPLVQARVEALRQQGRDAFNEYQVPQAVMMFRQGFGRLIRTATDRGIVAVLDPRVLTKRYGRMFLESLPECRVTDELDVVERFANPPTSTDSSGT